MPKFECWWRPIVALGVLCASLSQEARAIFDVQPSEASGKPGSVIRVWPLEGGGPSGAGSTAFRILYRSTSPSGEPIAVSGAIFIPPGPARAGGRDVIAWAHPTSGVVESCAPSLMPDLAGTIWGLSDMLARGYVVVATDYPGLGTSRDASLSDRRERGPCSPRLGPRRARPPRRRRLEPLRGVGPQPGRTCFALYRRARRKLCARLEARGRRCGGTDHLPDR